jgi:CIC family chloride channel protein
MESDGRSGEEIFAAAGSAADNEAIVVEVPERGDESSPNPADSEAPPLLAESTVLRDYSADSRMLFISAVAAVLGCVSAVLSWVLLRLIGLSTNLFYFQRWQFDEVDPSTHHMGWWAVFVPVVGGLLVGLIARFGSPAVRGHGMPEAVEAVVFGGARIKPRVAFLKPLATAVSIGSGGPFGAEGPVIATGGACGSLLAQFLPVTDAERSVLLVCGAAAGMAATFSCPLSAVLLAVELLLFEWRPRSLVPVAVACATAGALRRLLLGPGPIFPMSYTTQGMHHQAMLGALLLGVLCAGVAVALSSIIHHVEELYEKLPIHWMWFPAIGGLFVGLGGLVFPQALGVGYDVVRLFVNNDFTWKLIVGVLVVKSFIWIMSLSSNTAGGILAPLLMIGAAMGVALSHLMPSLSPGGWAVVGMTALLAASIGAPLTSAMLSVELTHNGGLLLPVLLACTTGYALSVLFQKRSLITAGLSRKGHHLAREYSVDPLEMVVTRDAMHTSVYALPADATRRDAVEWLRKMNERGASSWSHWQRIFPVVDARGMLIGMLTRSQMIAAAEALLGGEDEQAEQMRKPLVDYGVTSPATLPADGTLRVAAERMGASGFTSYPVVDAAGHFVGILNVADLLSARVQSADREGNRHRVLRVRWPFGEHAKAPHA